MESLCLRCSCAGGASVSGRQVPSGWWCRLQQQRLRQAGRRARAARVSASASPPKSAHGFSAPGSIPEQRFSGGGRWLTPSGLHLVGLHDRRAALQRAVQLYYEEVWNNGTTELLEQLCAPAVVYSDMLAEGEDAFGRAGLAQWMSEFQACHPLLRFQLEEVLVDEDAGSAVAHWRATAAQLLPRRVSASSSSSSQATSSTSSSSDSTSSSSGGVSSVSIDAAASTSTSSGGIFSSGGGGSSAAEPARKPSGLVSTIQGLDRFKFDRSNMVVGIASFRQRFEAEDMEVVDWGSTSSEDELDAAGGAAAAAAAAGSSSSSFGAAGSSSSLSTSSNSIGGAGSAPSQQQQQQQQQRPAPGLGSVWDIGLGGGSSSGGGGSGGGGSGGTWRPELN